MENMTMSSSAAMAAFVNETLPAALNSPSVRRSGSSIGVFLFWILVVSVVLYFLFRCGLPVLGFMPYGIAAASFAAGWMSSIGLVAAGSLFAILQSIAMGGVPMLTVLLCIFAVVALVAGAFEVIVWLIHAFKTGAFIHLVDWVVESWDSLVAWVRHLWDSIPVHHKWKILHT